jgi:hypothetical protein
MAPMSLKWALAMVPIEMCSMPTRSCAMSIARAIAETALFCATSLCTEVGAVEVLLNGDHCDVPNRNCVRRAL